MVRVRGEPRRQGWLVTGLVILAMASIPAQALSQPPFDRYQRTDVAAGNYPDELAIGDLNGDGRRDIAAPAYIDGTIPILYQDADGGFDRQVIAADPQPGDPQIAAA